MLFLCSFLLVWANPLIEAQKLDIHRELDRQRLNLIAKQSPDPALLQTALQQLSRQQLTPSQQHILLAWLTKDPQLTKMHSLLHAPSIPIEARILALQSISNQKDPKSQSYLWRLFLRSRFGELPEDPDLFERAIRILVQIARKNPQQSKEFLQQEFSLLFSRVLYQQLQEQWKQTKTEEIHLQQWPIKNPQKWLAIQQKISSIVLEGWQQKQHLWIEAMQSHRGSLMGEFRLLFYQHLIFHWKKDPNLNHIAQQLQESHHLQNMDLIQHILPPKHFAGQFEDLPPPKHHHVTLTNYQTPFPWRQLFFLLLGPGLIFIGTRVGAHKHKGIGGSSIAIGLLLLSEMILQFSHYPSLSQTQPLFSILNRQYQPFENQERPTGKWWIGQGGPSRWQEIAQQKPKDALRLFVLGASSAHASNHLQEEGFGAQLERKLQQKYPERSIQVVNYGIGGTTSNGVLAAGKQSIAMGADGFIIYYGHNEAAQFSQLSTSQQTDLSILRWRLRLAQSSLYAFFYRHLASPSQSPAPLTAPQGSSFQKIMQLRKMASLNYQYNMAQLIKMAKRKDIDVLLMNVATNYRFTALEAFDSPSQPTATNRLKQAQTQQIINKQKASILAYQASTLAHPGSNTHLQALRLHAELLSTQNKYHQARESYQRAIDHSQEITTVTSEIRKKALQTAKEQGCAYIDIQDLFYRHSPDGLSANALFWDELHPSKEGHRRIADAITPWAEANYFKAQ